MRSALSTFKMERAFWRQKGFGTILVFVALCLFFSINSPSFLKLANILNILLQTSTLMILSLGMTWIIISGGIDLSVGASMGFCGVTCAILIQSFHFPVWLGLAASIAIGSLVGLLNGLSVTKVHIPPLLATIGMSTALRGLAFIVCDGKTIFGLPDGFTLLGRGYLWIVPIPAVIAISLAGIFLFIQNKTSFSVFTYAIGGNINSARLSGIKTDRHLMTLYAIIGLLAGLAAFINASRMGVGLASSGEGMDFNVVTAVVLGGTSIMGGSGRIERTVLGCMIIGVLTNGMTVMNVHSFAQQFAQGVILLLAIGAETIRIKREM